MSGQALVKHFTIPRGSVEAAVPQLRIPDIGENSCEFLRITARGTLRPEECAELKAAPGVTDDCTRVEAVRVSGDGTKARLVLRAELLLHSVSAEEGEEVATTGTRTDQESPAASKMDVHVHVDITVNPAHGRGGEKANERGITIMSRALDWLRDRLEVEVVVSGPQAKVASQIAPTENDPARMSGDATEAVTRAEQIARDAAESMFGPNSFRIQTEEDCSSERLADFYVRVMVREPPTLDELLALEKRFYRAVRSANASHLAPFADIVLDFTPALDGV
jgi:hypothetical protein